MELINSNIIKLYKRYVDYTLILAKPSDISNILAKFNSYHPQIQFTLDYFPDNDVHFLDIKITSDGTTIFRKSTHTGQYSHISSFTLWSQKTAWIRALINRAHKICSSGSTLKVELDQISKFMSWNSFPRRLSQKLMNTFKPSSSPPN